jgi:3-oxoacyl-[acyl-carrier protein] reductase
LVECLSHLTKTGGLCQEACQGAVKQTGSGRGRDDLASRRNTNRIKRRPARSAASCPSSPEQFVTETLAAEGARIALASLPSGSLTAAAERVGAITDAIAVPWDLADLSAIGPNIATVERQLGPIEIIVNMTGGPPPTPASGQRPEDWTRFFTSMVVSVIAVTDAVLPGMRERRWGRIITNTSSGVVAPIPNLGLSNALRSSLVAWSKTLAREVGERNITSNIVVPGRVATSRMVQLDEAKAAREGRPVAEVTAESVASIPLGRYGDPREYADVVTFLASPRASYITGSIIRVDGGLIPSI